MRLIIEGDTQLNQFRIKFSKNICLVVQVVAVQVADAAQVVADAVQGAVLQVVAIN